MVLRGKLLNARQIEYNTDIDNSASSFTEKNFSTNLIRDELDLLSREDIKSTLEDNENDFTIKALRAASEVSATYRVDEQNMQIAIKYPKNFPLRQIDVEGVQKVGVSDRQWRGWMFSVAAVIGAQVSNEMHGVIKPMLIYQLRTVTLWTHSQFSSAMSTFTLRVWKTVPFVTLLSVHKIARYLASNAAHVKTNSMLAVYTR